jgi:hypothetical protein
VTHPTLFPYAGRSFVVEYSDELVFRNTYSLDGKLVTAEFMAGKMIGTQMTMPFQWKAVQGDNYLICWQEDDKSTVVHCDNFQAKTTQCFYTMMDGSFYVLSGHLTETTSGPEGLA